MVFILKDVIYDSGKQISVEVGFYFSMICALIVFILLGRILVKGDHRLRELMFELQALNELDSQIKRDKKDKLVLKNIEPYK